MRLSRFRFLLVPYKKRATIASYVLIRVNPGSVLIGLHLTFTYHSLNGARALFYTLPSGHTSKHSSLVLVLTFRQIAFGRCLSVTKLAGITACLSYVTSGGMPICTLI